MRTFTVAILLCLVAAICFGLAPVSTHSQDSKEGLFDKDDVLNVTIKGELSELLNDRGETPAYHNASLVYTGADNLEHTIPLKAKTRGHFRNQRANCGYPPLLLNFEKGKSLDSTNHTRDSPSNVALTTISGLAIACSPASTWFSGPSRAAEVNLDVRRYRTSR